MVRSLPATDAARPQPNCEARIGGELEESPHVIVLFGELHVTLRGALAHH